MSGAGDSHATADAAPGQVLAAARKAQNLGVDDVARQLRLSVKQVEALEAGQFDRLPGPVFVRGFIRNYAKLLRLDPDRLVEAAAASLPSRVEQEATPPSHDIPFPQARRRRWPVYVFASVLIVAGLAAYEFYWGESRVTVTRTAPLPDSTPVGQPSLEQPQAAQPQIPQEAPVEPGAEVGGGLQAQPPAPAPLSQQPATAPGLGRLAFVFERESWVQVRDRDGKTILLRHNPAGTAQQVEGLPPLTLVIGNAHGVKLTYNDRAVDLSPHTQADVARLTLP